MKAVSLYSFGAWLCFTAVTLAETPQPAVDFSRQIRPLLAEKCLACHGADQHHRQAGLRLDDRESALLGGESGVAAIIPGKVDESELIARIESTDPALQMPPPESKKTLTDDEKALLKNWVAAGAPYQAHWAFQTPVRPPVPNVKDTQLARNEIDRFVLSRLEQSQLAPSPPADKVTLFRRLTLDLTGLPPTTEEIDTFLADRRPDAIEHAVDRLLASPHYGERWGRLWLDAARYADSDGYEKDKPRFVWAYRDWVVSAFNRDLPYDQFIIEQLAGDLLPNPTQDQLVATGFLRNSMINEEGGIDPEQFRMEAMFDRVDALGKSVLGLTIQCCQCHDHKYDPISQREYFQLFAFFNDTYDSSVPVYTADQQQLRSELYAQISAIESRLKEQCPNWEQQLAETAQASNGDAPNWQVIAPKQEVSGGQKHLILDDGSILAQGYAPTRSVSEFTVDTPVESVRSIRLELLNHQDLPLNGPGRALDGTCALTDMKIDIGPADGSQPLQPVKILSATADVNPPEEVLADRYYDKTDRRRVTGPIEYAIDNKDDTAWGINLGPERSNVPRNAVFLLDSTQTFEGGTKIRLQVVQKHGGWNSDDNQTNNLGRYRFSVSNADDAKADPVPPAVRSILAKPAAQRTSAETSQLFAYYRTTAPACAEANAEIEALWKQHPLPTTQLSLADRDQHRQTFMLAKGNFLQPTEKVSAGVPAMLPPLDVEQPNRLDLARWLVDERSPTVARSIVNRVWQTYFGTGLVSTSEDFGLQGEPPSHPELLDWLAVDFMEHGWSLKYLHRQILASATYRQSSCVSPDALQNDPDNRLLARASRFRMEAEGVRDIALAASGLIDLEIGGPPVCPPCPEFLFQPPASYGPKTWALTTGDDQYRRALYTFRFRSIPYPALQVFDAPVGEVACVRRVKSNTPLQALAALNEPIFLDCARSLADSILAGKDCPDADRMTLAFRRCTGRTPDAAELATLMTFLEHQKTRLSNGELDARAIALGATDKPGTEETQSTLTTRAAWTTTCRVLLNLDQTITRE
ncbi:PSD1 and planctomycete cytochrome C domain-containing protein [Planctomicrobium piriforme]|nr:PSD1 and planctomycete cytochrome C domain-containing protein [Planctomicrobium piriforme]